jgi:thiosulfate/3-mercaptopyruvate sulfurtransferase
LNRKGTLMMSGRPGGAYPRPELIVEPAWLAEHLNDSDLRIIDCDLPEAAMMRAHIPNAVMLPIHPYFRNTETGVGVATAEQTEAMMRDLGVSSDTRVVCYDSTGGTLAARIWWVLWYYGHEQVAFLNGGWTAWEAEGHPTETEWKRPQPGDWSAVEHDDRIAACDVMLPWVGQADFVPLDVRAYSEWSGTQPNVANQREGHIPGAVHIEWREFVDWDNNTKLKPAAEIREMLEGAGVTRDKRVVPY